MDATSCISILSHVDLKTSKTETNHIGSVWYKLGSFVLASILRWYLDMIRDSLWFNGKSGFPGDGSLIWIHGGTKYLGALQFQFYAGVVYCGVWRNKYARVRYWILHPNFGGSSHVQACHLGVEFCARLLRRGILLLRYGARVSLSEAACIVGSVFIYIGATTLGKHFSVASEMGEPIKLFIYRSK